MFRNYLAAALRNVVRNKLYAAIKFFLFTLFGSIFMLISILALYFHSNPHTFDYTELLAQNGTYARLFQILVFIGFYIGFSVKIPAFPLHTWLPLAHVEAPTAVSVILAGVLLKMGLYGLMRFSFPILPVATHQLIFYVAIVAVITVGSAPETLEVPDSGDLAQLSPVRLYALAALTSASGSVRFNLEGGRAMQIVFRRGTPEHVSADDPDLSLLRFLEVKDHLAAEKAREAEEHAAKNGQDVVAALFQLQSIPASDAHRLFGEHAVFLLDRAFVCWRGKFTFDKEAAPPPGSFPLGSRWGLLVDAMRRLELTSLRARLGKRLSRPVVRSGGLAIGKLDELGLNAQETRIYGAIDGTKSGEELQRSKSGV